MQKFKSNFLGAIGILFIISSILVPFIFNKRGTSEACFYGSISLVATSIIAAYFISLEKEERLFLKLLSVIWFQIIFAIAAIVFPVIYFHGNILPCYTFGVSGFAIATIILFSIRDCSIAKCQIIQAVFSVILIAACSIIIYMDFQPSTPSNKSYKSTTNERVKCALCGDRVPKSDIRGKWCKDCQNNAFGEDGWYYDLKD